VRVSSALIRAGNFIDNLPTVTQLATRFAGRFNIHIPNFGPVPAFAGDVPINPHRFDVEMPGPRVPDSVHMDAGNGPGGPGRTPDGGDLPGGRIPGDNTPGGGIPGDNTPGDRIPGDSTPGDNTPGDSTPGDSTPGDSTPGDSTPGDSTPGDSTPGDPAPGQPAQPGGGGDGSGSGNPPGNAPAPGAPDPFDGLDPARQEQLIDELITDSNEKFPLSRENAEAVLRGGPPGTTPQVAGPGVAGGDVRFVDENGNVVLRRENKSIGGEYNSFKGQLSHAALEQLNGRGEVWIQVRPGTDVDSWIRRWQGSRTDGRLADYADVKVIFRDPDGNPLGEYGLGDRLPRRQ
jgi:hypothetical protein